MGAALARNAGWTALVALLALGTPAAHAAATLAQYRPYDDRGPSYPNNGYPNNGYGQRDDRDDRYGREDRYRRRDEGRDDPRGRMGTPGGSYVQSCGNIRQEGSTLIAVCRAGRGSYETSLDISRCGRSDISNNGGVLQCNGARGTARRVE